MSEQDPIVKKHSSLETPFGPRVLPVKLWEGNQTLINGSNKKNVGFHGVPLGWLPSQTPKFLFHPTKSGVEDLPRTVDSSQAQPIAWSLAPIA